MILKQGHEYRAMPHDGKVIQRIYRGGRCYYIASPYSPEATQALRAAFPQYWTAISDYGFAHPQLVPFINEDPMLIVSLIEVGKVRYIQNNQGAYIDTGIIPTDHALLNFETTVAWEGMDKYEECVFASIGNSNAGTGIYGLVYHGTPNCASFMCGKYNEGAATKLAKTISRTKIVGLHNNGGVEVYVNDEYISRGTVSSLSDKTIWIFLPNGYYWNLVSGYNAVYKLETLRFYEEDTDIAHFIPHQRTDGTCGMLDIVSLTFHPNANTEGAFTIQVTDKAT